MSAWVPIVALIVGMLTVLSLLLGLRRAIRTLIREVIVRVLVDVGLISRADEPRDQWPNGSTSLPVFLRTMWQSQEHLQATIREWIELERRKGDD